VHSLFAIPPNRSLKQYQKLAYGQLNTLQIQFSELHILIIDEVSMVGANMRNFIDQRMQEIFDSNRPFGNISILLLKNVGSHLELAFSKYQTLIYIPPLARVV
jgi:hypothetical protein